MTTLFISDLHLCDERPEINSLFLNFLNKQTSGIRALYILGDLFEVWIGDDAISQSNKKIVAGLKRVTQSGLPVFVMHGNRDFLLADEFCQQSGGQLISDPITIDLYGTSTLLMHGDTLCTDDIEYQKFRRVVRDTQWQSQMLAKTPAERQQIANKYRNESKLLTQQKEADIIDANQQAIESIMLENKVLHLIHGHTHRPGTHTFKLNNIDAQRTVLGDWYEQGSVLSVDENGYDLRSFG